MKYGEHLITVDENEGSGLILHPFINAGGLASGTEAHPEQFVDSRDTGAVDYDPDVYSAAGVYSKIAAGMRGRWIDGKTPSHIMYSSLMDDVTLSGWCPDGRLFMLSSLSDTMVLQKWPWADGLGADHSYELTVPHGLAYSNYPDTTGQPKIAWEDNDTFYLAHYAYDAATHRNGIYVQKYHDGALVWSHLLHDYTEYAGYAGDMPAPDVKVVQVGDWVTFYAGGDTNDSFDTAGAWGRLRFIYGATKTHFEITTLDGTVLVDDYEEQDWSSKTLAQKTKSYFCPSVTSQWVGGFYYAPLTRILVAATGQVYVRSSEWDDGKTDIVEPTWSDWGEDSVIDGHGTWTKWGWGIVKCRVRLENADASLVSAWSPTYTYNSYAYGTRLIKGEWPYALLGEWYTSETFTHIYYPAILACTPWNGGCLVLYTNDAGDAQCAIYDANGILLSDSFATYNASKILDWRIVGGTLQLIATSNDNYDWADYVWITFNGTVWSDPWHEDISYDFDYGDGYDAFSPNDQGFAGYGILGKAFFIGEDVYCGIEDLISDVKRVVKIVAPFKQLNTTVTVQVDAHSHPQDSWKSAPSHRGFFYDYLLPPYDWTKCGIAYYGPVGQSNAIWYMGI